MLFSGVGRFFQLARRAYMPPLPAVFSAPSISAVTVAGEALLNEQDKQMNAPFSVSAEDAKILRDLFPNTIDTPFVKLVPGDNTHASKPLKVGVVLSGGQAAGGHNVICGVFDYIQRVNTGSVLYGFLGGPHGVYSGEYKVLDKGTIDKYRNMGGFDMIKSGRHKIETDAQKQSSLEVRQAFACRDLEVITILCTSRNKRAKRARGSTTTALDYGSVRVWIMGPFLYTSFTGGLLTGVYIQVCKKLQLDGLVVIGGDDSNTNAAILAEYFKAHGSTTQVVGCPKTIDGDLKNYYVEISFGFDTACRTYSCSIGNLMMQTLTQRELSQRMKSNRTCDENRFLLLRKIICPLFLHCRFCIPSPFPVFQATSISLFA